MPLGKINSVASSNARVWVVLPLPNKMAIITQRVMLFSLLHFFMHLVQHNKQLYQTMLLQHRLISRIGM